MAALPQLECICMAKSIQKFYGVAECSDPRYEQWPNGWWLAVGPVI